MIVMSLASGLAIGICLGQGLYFIVEGRGVIDRCQGVVLFLIGGWIAVLSRSAGLLGFWNLLPGGGA